MNCISSPNGGSTTIGYLDRLLIPWARDVVKFTREFNVKNNSIKLSEFEFVADLNLEFSCHCDGKRSKISIISDVDTCTRFQENDPVGEKRELDINHQCFAALKPFSLHSGGSRISRRGRRQLPKGVRQPITLQIFCRKLHENE